MAGQRIGYVRVSSFDQNPERQLDGTPEDRTSPLPRTRPQPRPVRNLFYFAAAQFSKSCPRGSPPILLNR
jgi:hypothetical protein